MKKYLIIGGIVGLLIWFNRYLLPLNLVEGLMTISTWPIFLSWPSIGNILSSSFLEPISYILSGVLYAYIIYCIRRKNILIPSLILNALFMILAISYIFTPLWDWTVMEKSFPRICNFIKVNDPDSYNADDNSYFTKTCDQWNGIEPNNTPE